MNANQPLVTVIIPVFNGAAFLAEAIESILAQTYRPIETIVVDDGSTDESAHVAAQFDDVRLLCKEHSGLAPTLNQGVRHANGDLLAFLDADDRWLPEKLTRQVATLSERPELDLVFGYVRQFTIVQTAAGEETIYHPEQPAEQKLAMLIRRAAFDRVGSFSEEGDHHDFLVWYCRAVDCGLQTEMLPGVVCERRVHAHNYGRTQTDAQRTTYLRSLRAVMQRRGQLAIEPTPHQEGRE